MSDSYLTECIKCGKMHLSSFPTTILERELSMRIVHTTCTPEQQEQDLPELLEKNEEAKKTELLWEFFGGTITLPNGNVYQVTGE